MDELTGEYKRRQGSLEPDSGATFDFAEAVAASAQRAFGPARERNLTLLHDYRGITPQVRGSLPRIACMADHMLAWAIGSAQRGAVSFEVSVRKAGAERCFASLSVADMDLGLDASRVASGAAASAVVQASSMSLLTLAATLCQSAGGHFHVRCLSGGGTLARAHLSLECIEDERADERASAERADAWLIGQPPHMLESLARRMLRFGWLPRLFETASEALEALASDAPRSLPGCVLGAHPLGVEIDQIDALKRALPDGAVIALLAQQDAPPRRVFRTGAELHSMPLPEAVLARFARQAHRPRRPASDAGEPALAGRRASILIVDDDPTNRLVASQLLQALNYESNVAADGLAAVDCCLVHCPDAVLMDVSMPRMDGLTATCKLRQLQRDGLIRRFPVIGATGEPDAETPRACIEAGMDVVLAKPVERAALERTLSKMLAGRRAA